MGVAMLINKKGIKFKKMWRTILVMTIAVFASCAAPKSENDKGAIINMYLSQEIYDFDPAYAYNNDAALKVVDLLFASLFRIDEKGRLQNELAKSYVIDEDYNLFLRTINEFLNDKAAFKEKYKAVTAKKCYSLRLMICTLRVMIYALRR